MNKHTTLADLFLCTLILFCAGCNTHSSSDENNTDEKPFIVCTTSMIADALHQIAGDRAEVVALMSPGVDPHLYTPVHSDVKKLHNATVVFHNGLHLEGRMSDMLKKLSRTKDVITFSDGVPKSSILGEVGSSAKDPHIWHDVQLWSRAVQHAGKSLSKLYPEDAEYYIQRTKSYTDTLIELHQWVKEEIAKIPEQQRILVTAHDAFSYFGEAYNMRVEGIQGMSTISEAGLKRVTSLSKLIVENNISAVFPESSVPNGTVEELVKSCRKQGLTIHLGETLYADALGEEGTGAATYVAMIRKNTHTIVSSLTADSTDQTN